MQILDSEYLVSYGKAGDFGRFRPVAGSCYERGDRVLVRHQLGLDLGAVLCPVTEGHGRFLSRTALGTILRPASEEDERTAEDRQQQSQAIFEQARLLNDELSLPLEILDVEVLHDGKQATVYFLGGDCDYRPLVSTLSRRHDLVIVMQNLADPIPKEAAGCGKPDCGGGNCQSCGTGGGCSSCSSGASKDAVAAQLSNLRHAQETAFRTSLL